MILEDEITTISIIGDENLLRYFISFLQRGFLVRTEAGRSIGDFLRNDYSASEGEIINKIKTVLLNNKPVDNINNVFLQEDSTLALSGAMPGLVGMVLRSNSILASLRETITHKENYIDNKTIEKKIIFIEVKIFNVALNLLGPKFLRKGIIIQSSLILPLFKNLNSDWRNIARLKVNDTPLSLSANKINSIELITEFTEIILSHRNIE